MKAGEITITLGLEQARQAALGHPLGLMARETMWEKIYRLEADDKGETFPGDRPPWSRLLPSLETIRAELGVEDVFDGGTVIAFHDWRHQIDEILAGQEVDLSKEWNVYLGFVFTALVTETITWAYRRGDCSAYTVNAVTRTVRLLALALGEHIPDDVQ